jgi:quinol monooxygenase YgiN
MVQLSVRLTAASGRAHQLVQALHALMRQARQNEGCSAAHIAADATAGDAFWYSEDWPDVDALEAELSSDRFSQLLAVMETSAQPPLLEFRVVAETRGLEYVAAAREAANARRLGTKGGL